ncbi:O-antigen ligase [Rothia sp. ZJ932]|uniref:O-antigen ligase family protein n=1 Tax=Rothia sp. ZJ932 TaxID=2810516 RepID=UPI0019677437|nr:O-antigen ligase family protein [Rothia sp. ZJ932]QRZ61200.1 O-antigen ligase family protein [Rothia sp. ZJ932]
MNALAYKESKSTFISFFDALKNGASETANEIKIIEFICGFCLIFFSVFIAGESVTSLSVISLIAIRMFANSKRFILQSQIIKIVFFVSFFYLYFVSTEWGLSEPSDAIRRIVRMSLVVILMLMIANGKINIKSYLVGLSFGLVFNAIAWKLGIAPQFYEGYLTGWISDKNVSGLYYGFVPLVLLFFVRSSRYQMAVFIISVPLLWATGSRTSIAAFLIGILWLFFANKLNIFPKIFLGVFIVWFFEWLQRNYADSFFFGDRSGTDALRDRIDTAAWEKVQQAPWHGLGLGQATVDLGENRQFFFHNSYWTLMVEGGILWVLAVCFLSLWIIFLSKQKVRTINNRRFMGAESVGIYLAICSWRLGEVILTYPWAIAMGLALSMLAVSLKPEENNSILVD